ncbi:hypothetical protein T492DRAFT_850089 [Pavlovales sp. CCMP2436]|nr:hypothetical protein T492DRAFT_850089 [Pavlovales sp. CCMP2436]
MSAEGPTAASKKRKTEDDDKIGEKATKWADEFDKLDEDDQYTYLEEIAPHIRRLEAFIRSRAGKLWPSPGIGCDWEARWPSAALLTSPACRRAAADRGLGYGAHAQVAGALMVGGVVFGCASALRPCRGASVGKLFFCSTGCTTKGCARKLPVMMDQD